MMPLEGYKVLDLTRFLAGPFCTCILEDMGAEIIKFENPQVGGDSTRYTSPVIDGLSSYFMSANRGKKSVLADFSNPKIKELFLKMVADADVVVENFRPGSMKKLGLDYDALKAVNPKIIMTSISGFGQTGPMASRGALDMAVQALSGIMSITGEPGSGPQKVGVSIADMMGSLWGAVGTISALVQRERTGVGAHVDVAMLDGLVMIQDTMIARYFFDGKTPKQSGNKHALSSPIQPFKTKDGEHVMICADTQPMFDALCDGLGHSELSSDERFISPPRRFANRNELEPILEEIIEKDWTADDLCDVLEEKRLVYSRINNIPQMLQMDQIKAREMIADIRYSGRDALYHSCATPVHMSTLDRIMDYKVAQVGEDTFDVFSKYLDDAAMHEIFDPYFEQLPEIIAKKTK